jgi:hypothetical protein
LGRDRHHLTTTAAGRQAGNRGQHSQAGQRHREVSSAYVTSLHDLAHRLGERREGAMLGRR